MKTRIRICYWDANCLIALFNREPTTDPVYLAALEAAFSEMIDGNLHLVSCTVIQAEVFPEPENRQIYEDLLGCPNFSLVETVSSVYALAGEMRQRCRQAAQSLKTPDAIHIAAGHLVGANEIWTTDKALVNKSKSGMLVQTPVVFPYVKQARMVFDDDER